MTAPAYEGWAIVELFGHRVIPAYVSEVEMFGDKFAKVDTRDTHEPPIVQFYGGKAIYAITPATEEQVRKRNAPYVPSRLLATEADIVDDDEHDSWSPDDEDLPSEVDSDSPRGAA